MATITNLRNCETTYLSLRSEEGCNLQPKHIGVKKIEHLVGNKLVSNLFGSFEEVT